MRCPKCHFDHELQTTECLKCGIVFARYEAAQEAALKLPVRPEEGAPVSIAPAAAQASMPAEAAPPAAIAPAWAARKADVRELQYRAAALPLALLAARYVVGTDLRIAVGMVTMVLHESGHAITAWLTGRWAVPMLWVTYHGENRSWLIVLALTAAIVFGGFQAWKARRWGWLCAAGAGLIVQLVVLTMTAWHEGALIVFMGDGGAMVLATILMAMFYAPRRSAIYKSLGLRWGLLAIGAMAFMDVFKTWSGPYGNIPFGEMEGVNLSDPSLLTQMYGWSVLQLVDRYLNLATVCLVVLAALYVWGLVSAYLEMRSPSPTETDEDSGAVP